MPTEDEFASITNKKLMGHVDFDAYLLRYLRNNIEGATKRLFIQGSFEERMPLSSSDANTVQADLKPALQDGFAHDGAGHLLDLEQIDRAALFENVNLQLYEVGASYVEFPRGIRINPRTGLPEYDRMVEGIGVQAAPDEVLSIDPSTITFRVDALFEQGGSLGDHTGRQVRIFMITPADAGNTADVAIEICDVVFSSGQNQITTAGLLGQTDPFSDPSFYVTQLIGLTVLRDTATNKPSLNPESVFFLGTVEGNGGTPVTFDITGQGVIQAQSADEVTVDALGDWADSTSNPGGTAQQVFEKIVADLTSTSGGRGAAKLTAPALPNWADGTTNPADILSDALTKVVDDLTSTTGDRGAGKLTAAALADWADGTTNPADTTQLVVGGIVDALTSTSGGRGAAKLTAPALPNWADGTTNPATSVAAQLTKIVHDLASAGGASKVEADAVAGYPINVTADNLQNFLSGILLRLNQSLVGAKQTAEGVGLQTLKQVYVNPTYPIYSLAHSTNSLGSTAILIAVGDGGTILVRNQGAQWIQRFPDFGYTSGFRQVVNGTLGWVAVGDGGYIQTSSDTVNWTARKFIGNNLVAVTYKANGTATYCAVGLGGDIWTSTNLTTWTQQTLPGGASDDVVAVCAGIVKGTNSFSTQIFVATTATGKVYSSPDGVTWTLRATITGTTPKFLDRMLQNSSRFGYVALFTRASDTEIGVAYSDDGITWTFSTSGVTSAFDEPSIRLAMLDESIAYLSTEDSVATPYVLNAVQVGGNSIRPGVASSGQNIYGIGECLPFGATNVNGTLFVVGCVDSGDGVILSGAPFRPTYNTLPTT